MIMPDSVIFSKEHIFKGNPNGKTYQPVSHEGVSPKMLCDRIATSPKRKLLDQFIGFCSKLPGSRLLARSFQ